MMTKKQNVIFVEGPQNPKEILKHCLTEGTDRVYLGAHGTFQPNNTTWPNRETPDNNWVDWCYIINELEKADVWITLEYDDAYFEEVQYRWARYYKFESAYRGNNED